jgi:adenylate cyclase
MFTDMVGYTALGQRNESLSLALVEEQRKLIRPILARHNGREVKTIGDAFLVEFPSALDAVRCAYDIQRAIREFNLSLASDKRIHLRIGVHVGEVVESFGDISGDAVNVASRIEPLAEDGGVCLTRQVYDHVRSKVDLPLSSLGPKSLKNVTEPVEVYKMVMPWEKEIAAMSAQLDKTRIAVLPFTNMSSNPEEGYFADGMTEELITSLSGVRQLTVIARTSVMGYKGTTKKVREIGRELEVGSVLEGSVRKAGSKVRITAQLIDASTEGHLWAQNYDRQLEDVFAIQSEIAEKVAGELRIRLVDSERSVIEKKATENTEAYTSFLRGRELLREGTIDSTQQAIGFYEKAIELDPRFARAYVGLAGCRTFLSNVGKEQFDVAHSSARQLLERALNLDPNLPEAHAGLSEMLFDEDDALGSEAEARRTLELNPSLPEPYWMLFELAGLKGDTGEMVRWIQMAYRLDPIRPLFIWLLGLAYLYTGREREAIEHWMKNEQLAPVFTYRGMIEYYVSKGDLEKAKEFNAKAEKLEPTNPRVIWMGGIIAAMEGDRERALLAIRKIEEAELGPAGLSLVGFVYHALGDLDSYFQYMNKALEAHAIISLFVMYSPIFDKARADPRYLELVERIRKQTGITK